MGGCNRMLSLEGCESPLLVALSLFQILLLFLLDFLGPFTISDLVTTNIFSPFLQPLSEQCELSESFFLLRHSILVLKISFLSPICLVYPITSQTFFSKEIFSVFYFKPHVFIYLILISCCSYNNFIEFFFSTQPKDMAYSHNKTHTLCFVFISKQ